MLREKQGKVTYIHQKRKLLRNLDILKTCPTENLLELDLSENFIDNLQAFKIYRFQKLHTLYLSINFIISIQPLAHCHFPSLEKLFLFGNSIEDITPLGQCGLQKLKELRLGFSNRGNEIEDVSVIGRAKWKQLEELSLDCNNIAQIQCLTDMPFTHLTHLYISNNKLLAFNANILNLTPHLKVLSMKGNHLTSIKFLTRCDLRELEYLNLSENNITEIECLPRTRLNRLQKLSIAENQFVSAGQFLKCEWKQIGKIIYCISHISKTTLFSYIGTSSTNRSFKKIQNRIILEMQKCLDKVVDSISLTNKNMDH